MSDETTKKTILLSVKLDTGDLIVNQAKLASEIEKGNKSLKEMKKATGEGTVEYQKQKAEIQNLQREYKNTNDILKVNQRIASASKGSYEELLSTTKKMEIELKLMGQAGNTTSKEFLDLTAQVGKNKDALNVFNQGINVGTNNVGRYAESMVDVRAELKKLQAELINLKPGTAEFDAAAKKAGALKDQINDAKDATKAFASESKTQTAKTLFGQIGNDIKDLDFQGAADKAKTFAGVVRSISFAEVISGLKNLGTAAIEMGKAFLMNPFTLVIAAAAALTYGIYKLTQGVAAESEEFKKAKKDIDEWGKSHEDAQVKLSLLQQELLKNKGAITSFSADQRKLQIETNDQIAKLNQEHLERLKKLRDKADADYIVSHVEREKAINAQQEAYSKKYDDIIDLSNKQREVNREAAINKDLEERAAALDKIEAEQEKHNKEEIERTKKHNKELEDLQHQLNLMFMNADLERIEDAEDAEKLRKQIDLADIQLEENQDLKELARKKRIRDQQLEQQKIDDQKEIDQAVLTGQILGDISQAVTDAISGSLEQGSLDTKKFGKILTTELLSIAEKVAIAQVASSTAQSLAQPDSVATFGASGVIRAGVLTALIKAAFGIAKAQLAERGASIPLAEKGMILGGASHAEGGVEISANGHPIAIAERGELLTIVNKKSTAMLSGLSNLNQTNGNGVSFMERGGVIPMFQAGGGVSISGAANSVSSKYEGYNMMIKYMKQLPPPVVGVRDIINAVEEQISIKQGATI